MTRLINFLKTEIWRIRLKDLTFGKSFLITQVRVILLALRGFDEDKCQLRASALTFYTLLSVVPVMAVAFGIAKGFGFEKLLETQLIDKFPGQEEVLNQIIAFANRLLQNTRGGMIAGIGVAVLFWSVIKVLGNIERSFNDIWGVKKHRPIGRKFSDYLSIILLCPILIIMSSSITVFINAQVLLITKKIALLGAFSPVIFLSLKILPFVVLWLVFSFIYIFMPNTRVNFSSGILGGIVAGTIYQIIQWVYINFQVGVAKYNAIYGSFAALPLFLMWLQISWLILLFGAEISFAHQNVDTYEFEPDCKDVSYSFKKLLYLRVMNLIVKNFRGSNAPLTATAISHLLEIPVRLLRDIVYDLTKSGLLVETGTGEYKGLAYLPACDISDLTIKKVIDAVEDKGSRTIPVKESEELNKISSSLEEFSRTLERCSANLLLKDI